MSWDVKVTATVTIQVTLDTGLEVPDDMKFADMMNCAKELCEREADRLEIGPDYKLLGKPTINVELKSVSGKV